MQVPEQSSFPKLGLPPQVCGKMSCPAGRMGTSVVVCCLLCLYGLSKGRCAIIPRWCNYSHVHCTLSVCQALCWAPRLLLGLFLPFPSLHLPPGSQPRPTLRPLCLSVTFLSHKNMAKEETGTFFINCGSGLFMTCIDQYCLATNFSFSCVEPIE